MKNNTYQNAVDHLEFSDDLYSRVTAAGQQKPRFRSARFIAVAAAMLIVLTGTALAVSPSFREMTLKLLDLGKAIEDMSAAQVMTFTTGEYTDGVTIHYMELNPNKSYSFEHGWLAEWDGDSWSNYLRITEDYRLETLEMQNIFGFIEKNGRKYTVNFDYIETEGGILSNINRVIQKNENGEVFLVPTGGGSNQWPVYANPETGAIRDALPDWTDSDFEGRVCYADELMGGILVSTIVNDGVVVEDNSVSYNMLYWIGNGAAEARIIEMPEDEYGWYCENDTLYCKNRQGHLYRMNENFEFELICAYETGDDLTNGLYTVATEDGELAIVDVYTGETYVISGSNVDPGAPDEASCGRITGDIDETTGYNATRYGSDGLIALIQTDWIPEEGRVALLKLGILDTDSCQLKLLEIENEYDGYHVGWLDETRLAVIYENGVEQYLCVYEFTE